MSITETFSGPLITTNNPWVSHTGTAPSAINIPVTDGVDASIDVEMIPPPAFGGGNFVSRLVLDHHEGQRWGWFFYKFGSLVNTSRSDNVHVDRHFHRANRPNRYRHIFGWIADNQSGCTIGRGCRLGNDVFVELDVHNIHGYLQRGFQL